MLTVPGPDLKLSNIASEQVGMDNMSALSQLPPLPGPGGGLPLLIAQGAFGLQPAAMGLVGATLLALLLIGLILAMRGRAIARGMTDLELTLAIPQAGIGLLIIGLAFCLLQDPTISPLVVWSLISAALTFARFTLCALDELAKAPKRVCKRHAKPNTGNDSFSSAGLPLPYKPPHCACET